LHFEADDLAASGQTTAAEARYLEALDSPAEMDLREPLAPAPAAPTPAARLQDLEIRLALARLYLDQGRDSDGEEILDRVDDEIDPWNRNLFRMQRDALRSRLEIRRGEYEPAYRRLKKTLRLASPRRARVPWRHIALQMQLNAERSAVTEAYTLLAIAAHEQSDAEIFRWAMTESRARGVELEALN
jgi:tetratricopeptide (TPR) repeat protein